MISSIAYAMGQGGQAAGEGAGGLLQGPLPMLVIMFVIFYFLLIRPQQKKQKEHREMISNLNKGDRIITSGGLHGRITGLDETTLTVEIADKVRVNVLAPGNVFFSGGTWEKKMKKNPERIQQIINSTVPMQRFGTLDEIADVAVFLCSGRASFITGSVLVVDGGQTVGTI